MQGAVASTSGGTLLRVELSPNASDDAFPDGFNPWRDCVEARVKAPPQDGDANKALLTLIADHFEIPRQRVHLKNGHASTRKTVKLDGVDPETARSKLRTVLP